MLDDCLIRCQAMKSNQYAVRQADKIAKTEQEVQFLISVFVDWNQI